MGHFGDLFTLLYQKIPEGLLAIYSGAPYYSTFYLLILVLTDQMRATVHKTLLLSMNIEK